MKQLKCNTSGSLGGSPGIILEPDECRYVDKEQVKRKKNTLRYSGFALLGPPVSSPVICFPMLYTCCLVLPPPGAGPALTWRTVTHLGVSSRLYTCRLYWEVVVQVEVHTFSMNLFLR